MIQQGRSAEAEAEFERLLGGGHVIFAMQELSKLDRGDDTDAVNFSELLYGRHFRGRRVFIFWVYSSGLCECVHYLPFWLVQLLLLPSPFPFLHHFPPLLILVSLGFVIHIFLLQLFLLGQPYLLYNSYLV